MRKQVSEDSVKNQIKLRAESDLESFIKLVHSNRLLGNIHRELISWWNREDGKTHQLVLLPRDHMKSALIAYRCAWEITKNPAIRILYISSTSNLATKQLKFIKDILTSEKYRYYWPEMVSIDEGKREKWTESEISVDHPKRKEEAVRDPTIFTAGLTTSVTGLHFDIAVLDDVVVMENAYTEEGRKKVASQYSLLASVSSADALQWVVGTRYHPKDLYQQMAEMEVEMYDTEGNPIQSEAVYEVFERQVESRGDGRGEFLWPRQQRSDGKWFGFDAEILAKKKAQYLDRLQFRAQYYNDPNDPENEQISREYFQYFKREHLNRSEGRWYIKGRKLNLSASVDFAFSYSKKADYTAIVVVGVDSDRQYYVLDIDRFKTNRIGDYFDHILRLHQKWDFRKIVAEVTSAQQVIVRDLKDNYIKAHGLALVVEEFRPTRYQGSKEERIDAILQPKYQNKQIYHYESGNCQILEEELVQQNPPHDDCKDALANAIEIAIAPSLNFGSNSQANEMNRRISNSRFGGIL